MTDLIDTTEMYLKTIFELEEDGVTPLRARIVERLGHSGPTVSQTVGRMERDGLLFVKGDRRLELTAEGRHIATEVVRKHRLAERLLQDIIGLEWVDLHEEACRWEHVMSEAVENRLAQILDDTECDPYGNPIPGAAQARGTSVEIAVRGDALVRAKICRIGEAIQADAETLRACAELGVRPGALVEMRRERDEVYIYRISEQDSPESIREYMVLPAHLTPHLFVESAE